MVRVSDQPRSVEARESRWRQRLPLVVVLGVTAAILSALGTTVWVVLLTDGLLTAAVVAAACGWGAWPAAWLAQRQRSLMQQVCVAVALGLGILGVLTLILGVTGALTRWNAWGIVGLGCGLGVVRAYLARRHTLSPPLSLGGRGSVVASALLLPLAVPLGLALFGACLPPGVLWNGEARGYDVLEYHLEAPREYFDAGRITFLPHNVYASFPQQVEMLYLLLMHLAGGPLAAAIPAQLLHAALGILTVLAVMAWSPAGWPRRIVAVAAGCVPWLAYLACLAYVELGMVFCTAVAGGMLLDLCSGRALSRPTEGLKHTTAGTEPGRYRTVFAAGLCAGLAGGCKYTALGLAAAALAVALFAIMPGALLTRLGRLGLFVAGVIVAFSPWLIRNAAFTGNPVYPFGYRWFGGAAWSAAQDEQWARGHRLAPANASLRARLATTWNEVLASEMFGPGLFVLALAGVVFGRSRAAALLAIWLVLIVLGWASLTQMPGRFVVLIVIPLALLAGLGVEGVACRVRGRGAVIVFAFIALAGAALNGRTLARQLSRHDRMWASYGVPLRGLVGGTEGFAQQQPLNHLPPTAAGRVWLVGEARVFYLPATVHYTVAFSRDPWLQFAETASPDESVAWLRAHQVAYVVFSWPEIDRLRGSYGFPSWVTRPWVAALVPAGLRRADLTAGAASGDIDAYEVLPK